ncbi:hypothetical protein HNV08_05480 [Winogradskyella eckloniae]|uniref:hypothetical protein n=1 Tax=Winogradskyella eckloniae TaxID=1089306 RepID=UPI00156632E5|nr:hypothetical protein [Winogradskyella eckloniae]NRD19490.1 hypothetical protein [Winogradskyella eckloniae]
MKNTKFIVCVLMCVLLLNMQCDTDETVSSEPCGLDISIDHSAYTESDSYAINEVLVENDCITLTISGSGCDSANWVMTLIDSGTIAESLPPQRYLKLHLYNNEVCLAFFNKQEQFDLTPLKVEGVNEVLLHIEGFSEPILYTY